MGHRLKKVNSLLLKEINSVLQKKMHNPHIEFVTLTGVQVSSDLRQAKVFVASSGESKRDKEVVGALNHAHRYIQRELTKTVFLKYLPELKFYLDNTQIEAERIEKLLEDLHLSEEEDLNKSWSDE